MNIEYIKNNGLVLFECLSGSRSYNIHKETSDFDYRGVYISPIDDIFGFDYKEQINDDKNDIVYYEVRRFLQLLKSNNPGLLEMLFTDESNIIYKHPLFDKILEHKDKFITKNCRNSFGGYAIGQIKKAKGLNKKIVNPLPKERKRILDFCYTFDKQGAIPIKDWLLDNLLEQRDCGLVNIPNMHDIYGVYHSPNNYHNFKGIVQSEEHSNDVSLSSIPKGLKPICHMSYNQTGYIKYCKDYKEYWEWVEKRNPDRYEVTVSNGNNYDVKNLCHCIRLLRMASEIATQGKVIVKRPDYEYLMKIRNGELDYDTILNEANSLIDRIDTEFDSSTLPSEIDSELVNNILIDIRHEFYGFK